MRKLKVNQTFAYVAVDDNGDEGICGFMHEGTWMPMVCADWDRVQSLKPIAQQIADNSGNKIQLIKLSQRSLVENIKPKRGDRNG